MTERDPNQPIWTGASRPPTDTPAPAAAPLPEPPVESTPAPAFPAVQPPPADQSPTVAWTPGGTPAPDALPPPPSIQTTPVAARGNSLRWAVAIAVSVLVLGIAGAAAVLLTSQTSPSALVGYAPANSVVYGEARLDLPGDQRQKLGQFLSKFPGFADQSTLDAKIEEALDRIVRSSSQDKQDYSTKIKPWFGGELAFSVGKPASSTPSAVGQPPFLVMLDVTDATKARTWFKDLVAKEATTTETYNGVELLLSNEGTQKSAFAVTGKVMLIGDVASVKTAIDSKGNGALGSNARFEKARESVNGDDLGYVYIDYGAYLESFTSLPGAPSMVSTIGGLKDFLPEWALIRVQARGDAVAVEIAQPVVSGMPAMTNRLSKLAPHLPASTIAVVDAHDYGAALLKLIDSYRTSPALADSFKQVDNAASVLGGFDGIVGWMEDAGLVVTRDGSAVGGGLVFSPKDRPAAERLLTSLRGLLFLGGSASGITVNDEDHNGTKITVIDFGDLRQLGALAGGVLPSGLPAQGRAQLAYAVTDQVVVIGIGDSFVKAVLDAKPGASLADNARYTALLDRVGAKNAGSAYVDVTAVRELIEAFGSIVPGEMAAYEKDVKPYLLPLDAYIQANLVDGSLNRSVGLIVVK